MTSATMHLPNGAIFLPPDGGRAYEMGGLSALFKADGEETQNRYCVSEWWLEPNTAGPGAHLHEDNDEVFYVLDGRPAVLVGEEWVEATRGAFFLVPRHTLHDFVNRSDRRAGLLNFFIPGGFEPMMPTIVKWFEDNR